jgi:hypothetical protein
MLCNTSRTGLPAECHVFTIEAVFPSLLPRFDIRVFWITSTFLERIMLAIQGSTVPGISHGGKGGRCVGLTTLPPSCADYLEIWEP